jgi:hypothetical protein
LAWGKNFSWDEGVYILVTFSRNNMGSQV